MLSSTYHLFLFCLSERNSVFFVREDQMALQYAVESKHRRAELNNRYNGREKEFTSAANK